MKVEVTHLKAPWPAGVVVGSIVALAATILPAWAAGKCKPLAAGDERSAEYEWEPAPIVEAEFVVNPASEADRKAAETTALLEEQAQQLQDAQQALATASAEIASLGAQLSEANALIEQARSLCAAAEEGQAVATRERDAALAELQALRDGLPAVIGDGAGEALPPIDEARAPAAAKTSKKGAAA